MSLENLGKYEYVGHYDVIARKVRDGDFDAGVLKDTTALEWEEGAEDPAQVSASSALLRRREPEGGRGLLKRSARRSSGWTRRTPPTAPSSRASTGVRRLRPVTDAEYDVVRRLIAPFDKREKSPGRSADCSQVFQRASFLTSHRLRYILSVSPMQREEAMSKALR